MKKSRKRKQKDVEDRKRQEMKRSQLIQKSVNTQSDTVE